MKKIVLACFMLLAFLSDIAAQSYAFGFKGGTTVGFQKWDRGERDPLFAYHGIAFIESAPEGNEFAVFAQLGYHVKGSAVRYRSYVYIDRFTGSEVQSPPRTDRYEYKTLSLTFGGKQKKEFKENIKAYYLFGIRADYTLGTNLDEYEVFNNAINTLYYPINAYVRKFNYGATIGGGFEFGITELIAGIVEITVNPDFSKQYVQPPIQNVYDPYTRNSRTLPGLNIVNNTIELTVGVRFLHEIEYIDTDIW